MRDVFQGFRCPNYGACKGRLDFEHFRYCCEECGCEFGAVYTCLKCGGKLDWFTLHGTTISFNGENIPESRWAEKPEDYWTEVIP